MDIPYNYLNPQMFESLFNYVKINPTVDEPTLTYILSTQPGQTMESASQWIKTIIFALADALIIEESTYEMMKARALSITLDTLKTDVVVKVVNDYLLKHPLPFLIEKEIAAVDVTIDDLRSSIVCYDGLTEPQKEAIQFYNNTVIDMEIVMHEQRKDQLVSLLRSENVLWL